MILNKSMAFSENSNSRPPEHTNGARDIFFACPACDKNLVVDEAAEGLIVDCPQCHINVIVPPKAAPPVMAPVKPETQNKSVVGQRPGNSDEPEGNDLRGRLVTITGKLRELQTQRTEINNRLASRMNDINRDLVMMARLETSQQQVISELNQVVSQIGTPATGAATAAGRTRVNLRS
jgi:hypothetical protein